MASFSDVEENYVRLALLSKGVTPRAVRTYFDKEFPRISLPATLSTSHKTLLDLKVKRIINQAQWNLLIPINANEESDDDEIENTFDDQPDGNAVTPIRVPLSPRIVVNNILPLNTTVGLPASRPVTAISQSTAEKISVPSVNGTKKRRRVTQEDVFQMQIKVCKEQMGLYAEQRQLVKEQTEKEKKQTQ